MVRYSETLIDEIKVNNDIVDIISQYVVLKSCNRCGRFLPIKKKR